MNYNEKRKELKDKYDSELKTLELEEKFSEKINGIEHFINQKTVFIDAKNLSDISLVLKKIIPTNKSFEKNYGSLKMDFSYDINLSGGAKGPENCIINYEYNDLNVRLKFSDSFIEDFIITKLRSVNDTEHHYYGGISMTEINRMRVHYNSFKNGEVFKWHGSHVTCIDIEVATKIINYLKN